MLSTRQAGFSLIELLAVVGIFIVLGAVSVISWNSYAPVMALDSATQSLADIFELAFTKATTEENNWVVLLTYRSRLYYGTDSKIYHLPSNSYLLFDDDGWHGPGSRRFGLTTQFGGPSEEFAREFNHSTGNFHADTRHNDLMENHELFKGPIPLDSNVSLINPPDNSYQVRRLVFTYQDPFMYWQSSATPDDEPIALDERRTDQARVYLANYRYHPGDTTRDNLTHLRQIRVYQKTVRIIR